jgi:serralysin
VYKAYGGAPNNWSKADIDSNVFAKYPAGVVSATEFDPKSIMLYAFPAEFFKDGLGATNNNTKLSVVDKKKIRAMYPKS